MLLSDTFELFRPQRGREISNFGAHRLNWMLQLQWIVLFFSPVFLCKSGRNLEKIAKVSGGEQHKLQLAQPLSESLAVMVSFGLNL